MAEFRAPRCRWIREVLGTIESCRWRNFSCWILSVWIPLLGLLLEQWALRGPAVIIQTLVNSPDNVCENRIVEYSGWAKCSVNGAPSHTQQNLYMQMYHRSLPAVHAQIASPCLDNLVAAVDTAEMFLSILRVQTSSWDSVSSDATKE